MRFTHFKISTRLLGATVLALGVGQAVAAGASANQAAQTLYRQEMALCNSGQTNQDLRTCRREAGSALQEARRGGLSGAGVGLEQNALLRCAAHEGIDRRACEARMRGEGTSSGSVGGGGILRETVIVVPGS